MLIETLHSTGDLTTGPDAALAPVHQRARGRIRLGFRHVSGDANAPTRLSDLYQSGSSKAMLPRTHGPEPHAILVNTAGGLTGGDRFEVRATLDPGARATLATQTAERVYRASSGQARVDVDLRVGAGGRLDWLAQETILFEGGALHRSLELDLEGDATALLVEPIVLGRAAMGETLARAELTDHWRIRRDGRLIHAENLLLGPDIAALTASPAALDGARALATMVYFGADADLRLAAVRALHMPGDLRWAASAWDDKLVVRALAPDAQPLRRALIALMTCLRDTPLPRVWTM